MTKAPSFREGDVVVATIYDSYSHVPQGSVGVVLGFGGGGAYADPSRLLVGVHWYGGRHEAFPRRGLKRIHRLKYKAHPLPKFPTAAQERAAESHAIRDGFEEWMIQRGGQGHVYVKNPGRGWQDASRGLAPVVRGTRTRGTGGVAQWECDACGYVFDADRLDRVDSTWRGQSAILCPECQSADRAAFRKKMLGNPTLMIVHGNPPAADVEAAWCKFHQRDQFDGTVQNWPDIAGCPDKVFALGGCKDIDLGQGPQSFKPRPMLVCAPEDSSLWIISKVPMKLGNGAAGREVKAVTYDPIRASGKEPAYYRHAFDAPRPVLAPVGNKQYCHAILLDGGRYKVTDWIRN